MKPPPRPSPVQVLGRQLAQAGLALALAVLVVGLAAGMTGAVSTSLSFLLMGCTVLAAMPVVAVTIVLAEEIRRRDWWFVLAAAAVLALIAYTTLDKLR
jgi:uncharacterized protein involved in exopolysaccharide biosynthesis